MSPSHAEVRRLLRHVYTCMVGPGVVTHTSEDEARRGGLSADADDKNVDLSARKKIAFSEAALAMALKGLQRCTGEYPEERALLSLLASAGNAQQGVWRGESVANALYGLKSMNTSLPDVRRLLRAITRRIERPSPYAASTDQPATKWERRPQARTRTQPQAQAQTQAQAQAETTAEAEAEAEAKTAASSQSSPLTRLQPQHCAMALYGLQRMGDDCVEVTTLLSALAYAIKPQAQPQPQSQGQGRSQGQSRTRAPRAARAAQDQSLDHEQDHEHEQGHEHGQGQEGEDERWTTQEVAMGLYGLQGMGSSSPSALRVVSALAKRLDCAGADASHPLTTISGQETAMCLHGLRGMSTEKREVRHVLSVLARRVRQSPCIMSGQELSTALAGLQSMGQGAQGHRTSTGNRHGIFEDELLAFAAPYKRRTSSSSSSSSSSSTGTAGTGARAGEAQWSEAPQLIEVLTALVEKLKKRTAPLSGPEVCAALLGLQGVSADVAAVRSILSCLATDLSIAARGAKISPSSPRKPSGGNNSSNSSSSSIERQDQPLDSRHMAAAFFGLRNLRSSRLVVLRLLSALAELVEASPYSLTAQGVGNAFYGLQGMSSHKPEVRRAVNALAAKVEGMPESEALSGQNIGNALWGLRNMTAEYVEVRRALGALSRRIRSSPAEMNAQNLANALYSLNAMTDDEPEVREVLSALAHKLVQSRSELTGLDIGMALYGLRSMNSETPEVRVVLGLLILKVKQSSSPLQLRDLSRAMIGLLNTQEWIVDDFMRVLASKTPGMNTL